MDLIDTALDDFAENDDLKELWDSDYYAEAVKAAGAISWTNKEALKAAGELDWAGMLENGTVGGAAGVVLNDRLMTEASLGVISQLSSLGSLGTLGSLSSILAAHHPDPPPVVKTEHSYSLADRSDPDASLSDLESECFPAIPISEAEGGGTTCTSSSLVVVVVVVLHLLLLFLHNHNHLLGQAVLLDCRPSRGSGREASHHCQHGHHSIPGGAFLRLLLLGVPLQHEFPENDRMPPLSPLISEPPSPESKPFDCSSGSTSALLSNTLLNVPSIKTSMGLVRPSAVVVTQRSGASVSSAASKLGLSSLTLKLPTTSTTISSGSISSITSSSSSSADAGFCMPPTPPSCSGSDSECGGQSPPRTPPLYETLKPQFCNPRKGTARILVSSRNPINTPLISTQPKGATGAINLTEEEKRTLISEGYSIPSRLPLTKSEEKSLKKIRRKIKNKISAQESRRKKKEYMDALERKVEKLSSENIDCKRRIEVLQSSNNQLVMEVQRLQSIVEREEKNRTRATPLATLLS
ncbi:LOW QUALITY PROTEIN: cyclic AMP response element-binding protein A-like [Macrobrachium nipponense]|uniref:LOW QUALITY PROTEIN: cyclic AMP response element-binding protein A-like n=1 Tax=Macrobrachium nipponense TaxID=159736 RepID=UPI0030C8C416